MMLNGDKGSECDGMRLEHVLEFKYFGCVFGESGIEDAECCRKVASGSCYEVPG